MLISQELFDETLVESQELFEHSDDDAVKETLSELEQQYAATTTNGKTIRFDHLSLTHPNSLQGQKDRAIQSKFTEALTEKKLENALVMMLKVEEDDDKSSLVPMYMSLVLQTGLFNASPGGHNDNKDDIDEEYLELMLKFTLTLLADNNKSEHHPLSRDIKLQLSQFLETQWFQFFEQQPILTMRYDLIKFARIVCNGCEANKKTLVQTAIEYHPDAESTTKHENGLEMMIGTSLPKQYSMDNDDTTMISETCQLITILGKFQAAYETAPTKDGEEPTVSSAHANVKELYRVGTVDKLTSLAKQLLQMNNNVENNNNSNLSLLCDILSALRVMAIDNDIVQNMVALGILQIADEAVKRITTTKITEEEEEEGRQHQDDTSLSTNQISAKLAGATLGLFRNLCANDEIKSTLCKTSLEAILHVMEQHSTNATVQEHGCGILGAMALRQPRNATKICEAGGVAYILRAMEQFPNKVPLQRQGCLAIRNIASRLSPEQKQSILEADIGGTSRNIGGAEHILKTIAAKHQDSIDEAYAALRDLGITAVMYKYDEKGQLTTTTQMFGSVKSNFRPVYE